MGLIIALRVDKNTSYFRRYLRVLISQDEVNHVVLCSGYIEERLPGYSVIRDELWDIIRAKASKSSLELETLGGMFRGKWGGVNRSQYIRFVKSIRIRKTMNRVTNLTYLPYVARKKNWHAKISLFMKDKEPLAAIIGSSNLTRPAYGESGSGPKFATSYKNHNCECDVVIWTPDGPF
jgi:hypothetical protein